MRKKSGQPQTLNLLVQKSDNINTVDETVL